MRMRRTLVAVTVALTLGAVGCSNEKKTPKVASSNPPAAVRSTASSTEKAAPTESKSADAAVSPSAVKVAPADITYGIWDANQKPVLEKIAANFTAANPGVNVKIQVTPWEQYWTKLQAAASGGALTDVFWMNGPNFKLYASNGILAPLSDKIAAEGVDTSVYPKALVDLYSLDGKQYGMPKDFDTIALWYNKTLFDAAGVAYPTASWTWQDFKDAAAKLTDKSKGTFAIAMPLEGQQVIYDTIYQAGGEVISADGTKSGYDKPETIAGMKFWTDIIKAGQSPTLKQMTDTSPLQWFESGKTAMFQGGSWNLAEFKKNEYTKDKVDVAPLPKGAKQASIIHGLGNVVSAKSKSPDAAWAFAKYLGSKEAAETLAESGTVIPAYNGTQDKWLAASPQYNVKVFLDAAQYAVPLPSSKNTAAWQADEATIWTDIWSGKKDVEAGSKELAEKMNANLAKEK